MKIVLTEGQIEKLNEFDFLKKGVNKLRDKVVGGDSGIKKKLSSHFSNQFASFLEKKIVKSKVGKNPKALNVLIGETMLEYFLKKTFGQDSLRGKIRQMTPFMKKVTTGDGKLDKAIFTTMADMISDTEVKSKIKNSLSKRSFNSTIGKVVDDLIEEDVDKHNFIKLLPKGINIELRGKILNKDVSMIGKAMNGDDKAILQVFINPILNHIIEESVETFFKKSEDRKMFEPILKLFRDSVIKKSGVFTNKLRKVFKRYLVLKQKGMDIHDFSLKNQDDSKYGDMSYKTQGDTKKENLSKLKKVTSGIIIALRKYDSENQYGQIDSPDKFGTVLKLSKRVKMLSSKLSKKSAHSILSLIKGIEELMLNNDIDIPSVLNDVDEIRSLIGSVFNVNELYKKYGYIRKPVKTGKKSPSKKESPLKSFGDKNKSRIRNNRNKARGFGGFRRN